MFTTPTDTAQAADTAPRNDAASGGAAQSMDGVPATAALPAGFERATTSGMRAIVQRQYGSADELEFAEIARPTPASDEVLIEVRAAGVDRGVWHLMTGTPYLLRLGFGLTRPRNEVPGMDVSGVVAGVGPDVTRFAIGDEVFGIGRGAFAEYALATEGKLALKPAGLDWAAAAVVPISGLTAQQAVCDIARVERGQRVLVLGASGGVGSYAVQLAHAAGAVVTGVASATKADYVRSLGAARVIDYRAEDPTAGDRALRGHHRHRRSDPGAQAPSRPHPDRHPGHRRWRGRWPVDRWDRSPAARCDAVDVHPSAAHDVHLRRVRRGDRAIGGAARIRLPAPGWPDALPAGGRADGTRRPGGWPVGREGGDRRLDP